MDRAEFGGARARLGHAVGAEWMRQQDLGNAVAIQARLLLQFAEEARHAFGIEAGRAPRLDTDAVGFLLMRTRVADLDRKGVVSGKSVSVGVDLGGRRSIKKKK